MAWGMAVPTSYILGLCVVLYLLSASTHPWLILAAVDFMFLQPFPGDVVEEDEGEIFLPIMVNIIPSDASLPFDVVVSFSVNGGTATSKDISTYTHSYTHHHLNNTLEGFSICHTYS